MSLSMRASRIERAAATSLVNILIRRSAARRRSLDGKSGVCHAEPIEDAVAELLEGANKRPSPLPKWVRLRWCARLPEAPRVDADATSATATYYRLRVVDLDGSSDLSHVVTVERAGGPDATRARRAYPNPAAHVVAVELEATAGKAVLTVTDVTGRAVLRHAQSVDIGLRTAVLDLSVLPKGTYRLRLTDAGGATHVRAVMRQ